MNGFRRLLRDLTGGNDQQLVTLLLEQTSATTAGGELARALVSGDVTPAEARDRMREIEHRGDDAREQLVHEMSRTLTAPMDREDLFRSSRSIDDVLDNFRDFVREFELFGLEHAPVLEPLVRAILEGLVELERSVNALVDDPARVAHGALAAKKASSHVRRAYQSGVAALLEDEITADKLKKRELLRRLDVVGLRLGEAADALADGAMKRAH